LLVEHVRCAEHGEWVHADGDEADGAHSDTHVAQARIDGADTVCAGGGKDAPDHDHDHCWVSPERHDLAPAPPSLTEVRAPQGPTPLDGPTFDDERASGLVYSFAPKTSPPV
jgi:hypothetical protein